MTQKNLDAQIAKLTDSTREQTRKYPVYTLGQLLTKELTLTEAKDWARKNGRAEGSDDQLVRSYLAASIAAAAGDASLVKDSQRSPQSL